MQLAPARLAATPPVHCTRAMRFTPRTLWICRDKPEGVDALPVAPSHDIMLPEQQGGNELLQEWGAPTQHPPLASVPQIDMPGAELLEDGDY